MTVPQTIDIPDDCIGKEILVPQLEGAVRVWTGETVAYDCPTRVYRCDYKTGKAHYVETRPPKAVTL